ncbi:MAG: hypothetical protein IT424_12660 [Pirellulales bacterium]|nr:hypothetical protein [Pirellulales bacterium]
MFLAHSIRLRDPWQCEPNADGRLRWTRTFHRPTGLEADDDLWLVLSGLPPGAEVRVNGYEFDPRARDSFATSDAAGNDAPQSQNHRDPIRGAIAGSAPIPSVPEPMNLPAPSPLAGRAGEGAAPGTNSNHSSPPAGAKLPARFNLTAILADTNKIEILLPPRASPLRSQTSFTYDARLAIMERS